MSASLGSVATVITTLGAISGNRTYGSRLRLLAHYVTAGLVYARAGWQATERKRMRCAGFRLSTRHPRSFFTTFKEIFIEEVYYFEDLPERPFILDCGANIGMATVFFKRLRPQAEILAIEPSPGTVELLRANISDNGIDGVRVIVAALSDRDGQGTLIEDYPSGVSNRLGEAGNVMVELIPLSRLVDRHVDLLKVDVEGVDILVLEELEEAGKLTSVDRIVVEYGLNESSDAMQLTPLCALLERNGFRYALDARSGRPLDTFQSVIVRAWRTESRI